MKRSTLVIPILLLLPAFVFAHPVQKIGLWHTQLKRGKSHEKPS